MPEPVEVDPLEELDDDTEDPEDPEDPDDDRYDDEGDEDEEPTQWDVLEAIDDLIDTLKVHRKALKDNTKAVNRIEKVLSGVNIGKELMDKIPSFLDFLAGLRRMRRKE